MSVLREAGFAAVLLMSAVVCVEPASGARRLTNSNAAAADVSRIEPRSGTDPIEIEPRAAEILKRMSDYLTGLRQFSYRAENTTEVIAESGQKLAYVDLNDVVVRRPNRYQAKRLGVGLDVEFYYDGKRFTLYSKKDNYYAVADAPPTLHAAIDAAQAWLDLHAPAADLLYDDVYVGLMQDTKAGFYVGKTYVGGVMTHHLAFRGREVDWQIWIEDGARPLPRKYLITSKWMAGAPEYGVELTDWNLAPKVEDRTFTFQPPPGAQQIKFFRPGGVVPTRR